MTNRGKYLLCNIFDWALTWGGTAAVIVANYLEPYNPLPYKLTLTGIILVVVLIFVDDVEHFVEKILILVRLVFTRQMVVKSLS